MAICGDLVKLSRRDGADRTTERATRAGPVLLGVCDASANPLPAADGLLFGDPGDDRNQQFSHSPD